MNRRLIIYWPLLFITLFLYAFIFFKRDDNVRDTTKYTTTLISNTTRDRVLWSSSTERQHRSKNDFCVFSHNCKIPCIDPFTEDVMRIFQPPKFKKCTHQRNLFRVQYNIADQQYRLSVNYSLIPELYANSTDVSCFYSEIFREKNDSYVSIRSPIYFVHEWIVPRHIMGVIVECHLHKNISNVIQRDAFSFVQYPEYRNEENDAKRAQSQPSVILIGIDSMSRVNFQRTMPLTAKFVRQTGWYEMLGYNKVGDNTLPNLLALLTGSSLRQVADFCNIKKTGCLDALTYLWNHYKNAGYLTAYAEDISAISTFNYLLPGFVRQPVDYYLRPFLQATEQTMKTVKHFGYSYCVGRKPSFRYVFDFCQQMIQRFITETPKPLFGLFWTNSFSHDDFSGPASVDKHFVKYLNDFKQLGLFEKAIVILFSDHGQRQGQLMEFPTSFLEERLPMLYIHLPAWFHQKYPKASKALEKNQRRLCSTFDLHLTLKDVLLTSNPRLTFPSASPCMGTSSLFYELPKERRCGEACIAEHWCTCESYVQVSVEGLEHLGSIIVYRINQVLSKSNVKGLCHRLKLGKVLRIEHKQHFDESGNKIQSSTDTFRLKFTTLPNGGLFRATIECDQSETVVDIQEDFITRLNSYGNESYCVSENALKRFCVCLNSQVKYDDVMYVADDLDSMSNTLDTL